MSNQYSRKYDVNDDFLDVDSVEKYWFIGLIASDGTIKNKNQISLSQSGEDGLKRVEYVKSIVNSTNPILVSKTSSKDSYSIILSSEKLVKNLERYNVVHRKTLVYDFPEIPDEYISSFIAGYIEGDGCITISRNTENVEYLSASFVGTKDFIEKSQMYIPIKGNIRKHNLSSVYEIRWYGEKAIAFCDWLFQDETLYHSYKYENYIKAKQRYLDSRGQRYKKIKEMVLHDLQNGVESIMNYAKEINVPFQTIYKWKKEWIKSGVL